MQHTVNRSGRNGECLTGAIYDLTGCAVKAQPVLADMTSDHGDGGRGDIVIVKAGVVILAPAEHPGAHGLILTEQLVGPLIRIVADQPLPAIRVGCETPDEGFQFLGCQAHNSPPLVGHSR
jgi:hypothetical protein